MTSLKLRLQEIADFYLRKNFELLTAYVNKNHQLEGFQFITPKYTAPGTYTISHSLNTIPQDILVSRTKGSGSVTWNYDDFTSTTISVTIGGTVTPQVPTEIRAFIGTYVGD